MEKFVQLIKENKYSDAVDFIKKSLDEMAEDEVKALRDAILEAKNMKKKEEQMDDESEEDDMDDDENEDDEENEKDKE